MILSMNDFNMNIISQGFDTTDFFKMERLFIDEHIEDQFFKFESSWKNKIMYYNSSNFSNESLIEEFPFEIKMNQHTPLS